MQCPTCHTDLAADSAFCSACGAGVGTAIEAGAHDRRSEALLGQANVMRMRGQWTKAEQLCIDLLRTDPNNVHAHSLLGDVYRDQERYDEAAQWYQLALDLNPESAADRAKLAQAEGARRARAAAGAGTQRLLGLSPVAWIRGLTVLSVAFLVLSVALLVAVRRNAARAPAVVRGAAPTSEGASAPMPPVSGTLGAQQNDGGTTHRALAPPVGQAGPQGAQAPEASGPTGSMPEQAAREAALESRVGAIAVLSPGTAVVAVTLSDRGSRGLAVLEETAAKGDLTSEVLRAMAVRDGLRAAQAMFTLEPMLQEVEVAIRARVGMEPSQPLFRGAIARAAAASVVATAPPDRILGAFASTWWAGMEMPGAQGEEPLQ